MELALGTAQFGMTYGVTNTNRRMSLRSQRRIIDVAKAYGISKLDTAAGYGESENNLGLLGVDEFKVSTKIPFIKNNEGGEVARYLEASLKRLKASRLDVIYLHDEKNIGRQDIMMELEELKRAGKVERIGVSIYAKTNVSFDLSSFDVVQCQGNAIDRAFEELLRSGPSIFLRSVFLQGLLLADIDKIPRFLRSETPLFESWERYCRNLGHSKLDMCLYHSIAAGVDVVVVGCSSADELEEIASSFERMKHTADIPYFRVTNPNEFLIDPRRWPK